MRSVRREFSTFVIVGFIAAGAHYSTLFILVEGAHWRPVPATLVGFVCGGFVSYILNRRHTFASERPHEEATCASQWFRRSASRSPGSLCISLSSGSARRICPHKC